MSSHHFVKENQEPALFIVKAEESMSEPIRQLLEWSPMVVVHEQSLDAVLSWGIKIDVVVVHGDTTDISDRLIEQTPVKILSFEMEDRALETAFYFLVSTKQSTVTVIDDSDNFSFYESFVDKLTIILVSERKWSYVRSGVFEKWFPAKTTLQFRSANNPLFLNGEVLDSREIMTDEDGTVRLRSDQGFWVGELL